MTLPIGGVGTGGRIGLDIAREGASRRGTGVTDGGSFSDTLKQALGGVQASQDTASDLVQHYANGDNVELHQVMAASEEASISLQLLVELRNKFTDAYRTVINMQG